MMKVSSSLFIPENTSKPTVARCETIVPHNRTNVGYRKLAVIIVNFSLCGNRDSG